MRIILPIIFVCLFMVDLCAQKIDAAWSSFYSLPELTSFEAFPVPFEKIAQTLEEDRNDRSITKAWVYAVDIQSSLRPTLSGQWDTIPGVGYVWRIGIRAENALSLNIFLENFRLHSGMKLFVHGKHGNIAGPFDALNNSADRKLHVQSLSGDMIIIEWNIPLQYSQPDDFVISAIGYGFRKMTASNIPALKLLDADDCNIDINCLTGNHWQREKRSVVLLQTRLETGQTLSCTGTLVNQAVAPAQKKNYILTANHCVSTNAQAQSTIIVFGYEKQYCDDDNNPLPNNGMNGVFLVSTKKEIDFTLLELRREIPPAHRPFYAGWTISAPTVHDFTSIHHPQGDTKKISISKSALTTATFKDPSTDLYCDKDAHWKVSRWESGTTEQGSSGSPIFDVEHKIVGTLSGGDASCSSPLNDYYSKFSEQWKKSSNPAENLKNWLDPLNKGVTSIGGYDPITGFEGRCELLGHIGVNENKVLIKSSDWGYLTSLNDRKWVSFAEKISNDSIANIIGIEAQVAKVPAEGVNVIFAVWEGNEFPIEPPVYQKNCFVTPDFVDFPMQVFFDRVVSCKDNFFIGYSLQNNAPNDTFAVYQSSIRPYAGVSAMFVKEDNGIWEALENKYLHEPPLYSSLAVKAIGLFSRKPVLHVQQPVKSALKVSYQQGSSFARVYLDDFEEVSSSSLIIEFYDTSGKRVMSLVGPSGRMDFFGDMVHLNFEINVSKLPAGLYLIQAFNNNENWSGKFVKM